MNTDCKWRKYQEKSSSISIDKIFYTNVERVAKRGASVSYLSKCLRTISLELGAELSYKDSIKKARQIIKRTNGRTL